MLLNRNEMLSYVKERLGLAEDYKLDEENEVLPLLEDMGLESTYSECWEWTEEEINDGYCPDFQTYSEYQEGLAELTNVHGILDAMEYHPEYWNVVQFWESEDLDALTPIVWQEFTKED